MKKMMIALALVVGSATPSYTAPTLAETQSRSMNPVSHQQPVKRSAFERLKSAVWGDGAQATAPKPAQKKKGMSRWTKAFLGLGISLPVLYALMAGAGAGYQYKNHGSDIPGYNKDNSFMRNRLNSGLNPWYFGRRRGQSLYNWRNAPAQDVQPVETGVPGGPAAAH